VDLNQEINFTGIVVTYNEEKYLRECLKSLAFCEQLLVIDLGSNDGSTDIAKQCGAEIIHHERVPIVEEIRDEATGYAKNDWIIYLDPDEIFPLDLEDDLKLLIRNDSSLGLVKIPWQFYFKGKPLNFTIWGMKKAKDVVVRKDRSRFSSNVHRGIRLLEGYNSVILPRKSACYIKHYWIDSYHQLFEKHWRYIKAEGESRYQAGERFSWLRWMKGTIAALKYNLFDYSGMRGGLLGIFLSTFYAWYICMSLLSLRRYQKLVES